MEPFGEAIKEHLELKERNSGLERVMPLASYRAEHVLANDASFRSEADAQQVENSSESEQDEWPLGEPDTGLPVPEELWVGARAFDWGD
jgi:hypothetical protein